TLVWLRCTLTPGQSTSEYAVSSQRADGTGFSLFAPENLVWLAHEPTHEQPTEGLLCVEKWDTKEDLVLICLASETLEDAAQFVTVKSTQLRRMCGKSQDSSTSRAPKQFSHRDNEVFHFRQAADADVAAGQPLAHRRDHPQAWTRPVDPRHD